MKFTALCRTIINNQVKNMDNYYAREESIQGPEASLGLYLQYINIRRFGSGFRSEETLASGSPVNGDKRHGQTRQPAAIEHETALKRNFSPRPRGAPNSNKRPRKSHPARHPAKAFGLVYQKLFADPGFYYRLPLEPFIVEARDQMQAPERMEGHSLIDCLIQIYRIYRPIALKQLAYVELDDPDRLSSLHILTPQQAHLLGIPLGGPSNPDTKKPAQILRPGNHILRLSVVSDPSIEMDKNKTGIHSPVDNFVATDNLNQQGDHQ
jgi:hypothetical protein